VSKSTRRWPELSAPHEDRYTGNERFLIITTSKTSGVDEVLCGLMVRVSRAMIRQQFSLV